MEDAPATIVEQVKPLYCPKCHHKVIKAGMAWSGQNKRQQYRCLGCGRITLHPLDKDGCPDTNSPPYHKSKIGVSGNIQKSGLYCPKCNSAVAKSGIGFSKNIPYQQYCCHKCGHFTIAPIDTDSHVVATQLSLTNPTKIKRHNKSERMLYDYLSKTNGTIYHNGYPDYMFRVDNQVIAIEVKPKTSSELTIQQDSMMELLHSCGIYCYKWTPKEQFCPLFPNTPPIQDILHESKDNPITQVR